MEILKKLIQSEFFILFLVIAWICFKKSTAQRYGNFFFLEMVFPWKKYMEVQQPSFWLFANHYKTTCYVKERNCTRKYKFSVLDANIVFLDKIIMEGRCRLFSEKGFVQSRHIVGYSLFCLIEQGCLLTVAEAHGG